MTRDHDSAEEAAVLAAELRFGAPGDEESTSRLRYTATYVKRDGRWRAIALQMAKRDA